MAASDRLIQASGVQMQVGGLTVLLGVWMDLGSLILAAFLIPAAVLFHAFWNVGDPELAKIERLFPNGSGHQ